MDLNQAFREFSTERSLDLPKRTLELIEKGEPYKDPFPDKPLDETQSKAFSDLRDWIIHPEKEKRIITLGGYAGTGKTSLIAHLVNYLESIELDYAVLAFTGKAVSVLKTKGIKKAATCHSHIYNLDNRSRGDDLKFIKKPYIDEFILIIDEASTISKQLHQDLLSYGKVRIIYVGDHGQLKPIGEDPDLMEDPDIRLEVPHRQAMGSNVLQFAHSIRQGKIPRYGKCPNVEIAQKSEFWNYLRDPQWATFDSQVLVGFNNTRHRVNSIVRAANNLYGRIPDPGEKIIFLNNNRDRGIYNGMILKVLSAKKVGKLYINVDLEEVTGENPRQWKNIPLIECQFGQNKISPTGEIADALKNKGAMLADYAYSLTTNKAQGSEWDNVLVIEECHPDNDLKRWAYTAVTRAAKTIIYCR
jgi:exodeoxyribonuclease-5